MITCVILSAGAGFFQSENDDREKKKDTCGEPVDD